MITQSIPLPSEVNRSIGMSLGIYNRGNRRRRKILSRDELVDHLRRHSIHSIRELKRFKNKGDPTTYDFQKEFGSWGEAKIVAFGRPLFQPDITEEYFLECVLRLGLDTWRKYRKARREDKNGIPATNRITKMFGSFGKMVMKAYKYDISRILELSLSLKKRLGRTPTLGDYNTAGIETGPTIKWFGGKEKWDEYLERAARILAKRKAAL